MRSFGLTIHFCYEVLQGACAPQAVGTGMTSITQARAAALKALLLQPVRFALVVAAYLANLATVTVALHWLYVDSYVAQAAGVAPYAIVTYCGSKWFAFYEEPAPEDPRAAGTSVM
jgi:hypothetical protein